MLIKYPCAPLCTAHREPVAWHLARHPTACTSSGLTLSRLPLRVSGPPTGPLGSRHQAFLLRPSTFPRRLPTPRRMVWVGYTPHRLTHSPIVPCTRLPVDLLDTIRFFPVVPTTESQPRLHYQARSAALPLLTAMASGPSRSLAATSLRPVRAASRSAISALFTRSPPPPSYPVVLPDYP